jgi:thiamine-phosphate pyrophosphorylase
VTPPDLIAITDDSLSDADLEARVTQILTAVPRASTAIQLRDRRRDARALLALGSRLRRLSADHGAMLIVNDRIDIALAIGADGVHLGGRSSRVADARQLVGASTFLEVAAHEPADVEAASRAGATAALVSPIFATPGKGPARGVTFLAEACAHRGAVIVFALGGIDAARTPSCMAAGAHGVAAIGSLFAAGGGGTAAAEIVAAVRAHRVYR